MAASPYMLHSIAKKINFDLENDTVETIKDENVVLIHQRCSSPTLELLDQNSSQSLESQKNCCNKLKQLDQQNASACSGSGHSDERGSLATVAKHMDMPISAKSESSAFEVADVTQISKVRRKPKKRLPSESLHHNSDDSNDNCHGILQNQVADCPSNDFCMENNHSGKKRKATELLSEENTVDKIGRIGGTLNVHTNENMDLQIILQQSDDTSDREKLGNQIWKNYNDILAKFSGSTTHLLGSSADKLNLKMKITEPLSILRHRKVLETRMMLYSIAYEKAKAATNAYEA
ncbi:hypothetical protein K1719_042046 [Acacia pycnantha]|nr:hypothetical protein K1719_042046 [Acacia pycnantha]